MPVLSSSAVANITKFKFHFDSTPYIFRTDINVHLSQAILSMYLHIVKSFAVHKYIYYHTAPIFYIALFDKWTLFANAVKCSLTHLSYKLGFFSCKYQYILYMYMVISWII
jgi:hypothetical protein